MFLINSRSHRFSAAALGSWEQVPLTYQRHTFSRSYGVNAEFLLLSSLKRLRIFILPTCVGLRYGPDGLKLSGFSWKHGIRDFRELELPWSRASVVTTPRISLRDPPTRFTGTSNSRLA